jgi:hypothetical protein
LRARARQKSTRVRFALATSAGDGSRSVAKKIFRSPKNHPLIDDGSLDALGARLSSCISNAKEGTIETGLHVIGILPKALTP